MRLPGLPRKGRLRAPFFAALLAASPASAQEGAPRLALPVACALGDTCYIQQYVDRTPGPGIEDFACGALANDGHKGTDFAVPTEAAMEAGIPVIAAADGIVRGLRDGMADIRQGGPGAPDVSGAECGNGVLIDHGGGWETQYCHLREGSVAVTVGDRVSAGQRLGLIGMSGLASFPHVHVELRHEGEVIDPFSPDPDAPCGKVQAQLWETPLAYEPGGPIAAGFADDIPTLPEVEAGLPEDGLGEAPSAIVLWVFVANAREGDTLAFRIDGPMGTFAAGETGVPRSQPLRMEGMGRRAPPGGIAEGTYTGTVIHRRGGDELGRRTVRAEVP
jgi:hypothetical protein